MSGPAVIVSADANRTERPPAGPDPSTPSASGSASAEDELDSDRFVAEGEITTRGDEAGDRLGPSRP
jgi:hypothetical protein